jgi:hypothetical protein
MKFQFWPETFFDALYIGLAMELFLGGVHMLQFTCVAVLHFQCARNANCEAWAQGDHGEA